MAMQGELTPCSAFCLPFFLQLNRAADRGHDISTSEAGSEYAPHATRTTSIFPRSLQSLVFFNNRRYMTDLVYVSWAALVVGAVTGYANLLWLVVR